MANYVHREPIRAPWVWDAASLEKDRRWLVELGGATRKDLQDAGDHLAKTRADWANISPDSVDLGSVGPILREAVEQVVHGRGFVVLRGLPVSDFSLEATKALYWAIALQFGHPKSQTRSGVKIKHVTDTGADPNQLGTWGNSTAMEALPHSDITDVLSLLCIHKAKQGGLSGISSTMAIYNEILATRPDLLEPLYDGYYNLTRGEGSTGESTEVSPEVVPIFDWHAGALSCHYTHSRTVDGIRYSGIPISQCQQEALDYLRKVSCDPRFEVKFDLQPGDLMLVNNRRLLHSRTAYVNHPDPAPRRLLLRLWIVLDPPMALSPRFSLLTQNGISMEHPALL